MRLVYIAGPYRATTPESVRANCRLAEEVAIRYWRNGDAVICPHANTCFLAEADGDTRIVSNDRIMLGDLEMVRRSDAIVMLPRWESSFGARAEHEEALRAGKIVVYEERGE